MLGSTTPPPADARPIIVDLDGTLVRTDTLWENFLAALRVQPITVALLCLPWIIQGRASLKRNIALVAQLSPACLPYRREVVEFVRAQAALGRKVFLVTAADHSIAASVAEHVGCFAGFQGSEPNANLKGREKLSVIRGFIGNDSAFDYIGDSPSDLPIWQAATGRLVAGGFQGRGIEFSRRFNSEPLDRLAVLRLLRPHQWLKNCLVFLPLMMAHQFASPSQWVSAFIAFAAMCSCASGVYILNDSLDLAADRAHHRKRHRPLASGEVSVPMGLAVASVCFSFAVGLSVVNGLGTAVALAIYLLLTTLYSFKLKRLAVVDVLLLASLYTLRVLIGGIATATPLSPWLLGLSMFLFLSLALAKRFAELEGVHQDSEKKVPGRGYRPSDTIAVGSMGIASGFLAILVFTLYINGSSTAIQSYPSRGLLWLVAPLLLYWTMRLWLIAYRGQLDEDPVLFAAKDRVSWIIAVLTLLLGAAASVSWPVSPLSLVP